MKKMYLIFALALLTLPLFAQDKNAEVSSEVTELSEFHDVIYAIWHTAWPQKDTKMLQELLPDIERGYLKIKTAKLPGILRDKQTKWDEGVEKLGTIFNEYQSAAAAKDSAALLSAAEKLHSQFEILVRVVRPKLKEIDAFHQVLYMVYHYYMPEDQFDKIKEATAQLKTRSLDITKAQLSAKQKTKEEQFNKLSAELVSAVNNLDAVVSAGNDKENIRKAVETMHSKYEELEKVFD